MGRRIAFLFPGQGRLPETLPPPSEEADEHYRIAAEGGLAIRKWILDGDAHRLAATRAAQPTILIDSLARERALRTAGVIPVAVAGHSLGEFAALASAGVLDRTDVLRLVMERGRLMSTVSGAMAAIVKLNLKTVTRLCAEAGPNVVVANHNGRQQIVVSGTEEAVARVIDAAEEAGGRGIRLQVSGAFHSPFMEPARDALATLIDRLDFRPPSIALVSSVSGQSEDDPERIRELMRRQMAACVHWVDVVERLADSGITHAIEVGSGSTLVGLGKRITDRIEFLAYEEASDGSV